MPTAVCSISRFAWAHILSIKTRIGHSVTVTNGAPFLYYSRAQQGKDCSYASL